MDIYSIHLSIHGILLVLTRNPAQNKNGRTTIGNSAIASSILEIKTEISKP